jgi:hypothetical protein
MYELELKASGPSSPKTIKAQKEAQASGNFFLQKKNIKQ